MLLGGCSAAARAVVGGTLGEQLAGRGQRGLARRVVLARHRDDEVGRAGGQAVGQPGVDEVLEVRRRGHHDRGAADAVERQQLRGDREQRDGVLVGVRRRRGAPSSCRHRPCARGRRRAATRRTPLTTPSSASAPDVAPVATTAAAADSIVVARTGRERVAQRDQPLAEVTGGGEAQVVRGDVAGAMQVLGHRGAQQRRRRSFTGRARAGAARRAGRRARRRPRGSGPDRGRRATPRSVRRARRRAAPARARARAAARRCAGPRRSSPAVGRCAGSARLVAASCDRAGRHTRAPRTSSTSSPTFRCPARPTTGSPTAIADTAAGQLAGHSEVGV